MKTGTKIAIAGALVATLGIGGIFVAGRMGDESADSAAETEQEVAVSVIADVPEVGELAVTGTYIGTVSPQEQVNVIPMVTGEVTEVNFEVGDYVEAGSVLVRVDDEAARMQLESAQLSKQAAELSADRTLGSTQYSSNLSMVSSISGIEQQIEMAQKQYDAAGDSVEDAKEAKQDLQEALDKINDSIADMESGYSSLRQAAVSAKSLVEQDAAGVWRWKADLLKDELNQKLVQSSAASVERAAEVSQISGNSVSDNDLSSIITVPAVNNSISAEEKAALEAQIAALEAAANRLKAEGYSPADIGEGRMDESVTAYASQIATLKSQAATLESNLKSMDSTISQAEMSQSTTADTINMYRDNLKTAQTQYFHQNNQAYQDTAEALANQVASAQMGVESAQMQLENYVITALISGYIEQKNVDEHGMVSAGNPVYIISNKDSMTVTFYVSEGVRNQLVIGQEVDLERSGQTWKAVITQIGQSVDARTGLFEVKVSVNDGTIANGVIMQIHVATAKVTDALLIPYDAVYFEGENAYVYCVADGVLVKTPVATGLYDEETIEILSGITHESVVVKTWSPQLADGVKVRLVGGQE